MNANDGIVHREVMELAAPPARVRELVMTPERILDYYPAPIEGGVFEAGRALDDYGTAVIQYGNGALGTVTASQISHGRENDLWIEVDGTYAMFDGIDIPFTGSAPDGYRGRVCFNSSSIPNVVEAIDHLEGGGQLSELSVVVQSAYISTVNAVKDDVEAECITAAPGQCTNAVQVCTGIGADMYEQLVVDETCVLQLGGVEPIVLGPGETCEFVPVDQATGSAESGEQCAEVTTGGGGSGADETSGGGADESG